MKFEKLTDTKIKIILSVKDLETSNISVENILSNSADSQKLLENIIIRAEKELGFKPEDSKLLIEAVAPSNEECIFIITKLLDDKVCCSPQNNPFVFKFDSFDDFINLCTFLNNFHYLCLKEVSKNFSLIYYNNTYYLRYTPIGNSCIVVDYIRTLFAEFGQDISNSTGIDWILNEFGKIVFAKNAILKCINSFSN